MSARLPERCKLSIQRSGEKRLEIEGRLFELICDLIPRRGALVLVEGDRPAPLAGFNATGGSVSGAIPESIFDDVGRTKTTMTGSASGFTWLGLRCSSQTVL